MMRLWPPGKAFRKRFRPRSAEEGRFERCSMSLYEGRFERCLMSMYGRFICLFWGHLLGARCVRRCKAPNADFFTWLPVGVNSDKLAHGSVSLI